MTFYWEQLCASNLGGSYNILFKDVKHDVCKETIIKMNQDKPESEDVIFYFNGELQEFKTEEELVQEIQRRNQSRPGG